MPVPKLRRVVVRRSFGPGALAALLALASAGAGRAEEPRRGPFEIRDGWLLAQTRLTLPALSPDIARRGRTWFRLEGGWGNDFGWRKGAISAQDPRFLIDGEHRSAVLAASHGLGRGLAVEARLPLLWRGAGVLDGVIDWWHGATGLPDNGRPLFPTDRFVAEGRDEQFRQVRWTGQPGTGLGNGELALLSSFGRRDGWGFVTALRATLPTASGPFQARAPDLGLQAAAAHPLTARADVFFGVGAVRFAETERDGLRYPRLRTQGFLALEARPLRRLSAVAQVEVASRLLTDVAAYPGFTAYLTFGLKADLGHGYGLDFGVVEGLIGLQGTTDFGISLGMTKR